MNDLPDGIYLDLSFADYLGLQRVGSSSITNMMEGPSKYWADSWMNPDRPEDIDSDAMKLGRAYHAARLEPETFLDLYCRELVPEDLGEGLLKNGTEIGEALAGYGETKKKAGESVVMQGLRLLDVDPAAKIWALEREEWEKNHASKDWIKPKEWDEINRDAERVRSNPELAALISGGMAEVSILFTDPETGLKCKIRPDYMGPSWITHLKTWDARSMGKPSNRAVVDAFNFNGYYRTTWFYRLGVHAIAGQELKLRAKDGKILKVADQPAPIASLVAAWQTPRIWEDWVLFVRRSGVPDIRARRVVFAKLPAGVDMQATGASVEEFNFGPTALAIKADLEIRACLKQITECIEIYGTDGAPWYPRDMMGLIEDDDFSPYWLESMNEPR